MDASDLVHKRMLRWGVLMSGGWEYLLPVDASQRVLCVDCTGGMTALLLSRLCREVHVVPHGTPAAEIMKRAAVAEAANVRIVEGGLEAAGTAGSFDGFVLHDLRGTLPSAVAMASLEQGQRLVGPRGFLFAALRNATGYARARNPRDARGHAWPARVARLVGKGRGTRHYPMIDDDGRLCEVIPPTGYVSAKNPERTSERVRRWVLGRAGAPRFSPTFGVLAKAEGAPPSAIDRALATLADRAGVRGALEVKRYHVLNGGKVILSVGPPGGKYGTHILVLVRSREVIERRRYEARLLERLAELPADLAGLTPRFLYEAELDGVHVFAMNEFPGPTLDARGPGLVPATRDAIDFLTRLHAATRKVAVLDAGRCEALLGPMADEALRRYPAIGAATAELLRSSVAALAGQALPLVWMHGDFKIENVVIAERTHRLLGVIDWELAEPEGLPLLDLWYLLLYNRQIARDAIFFDVAPALFPPESMRGPDADAVAAYVARIGVPESAIPGLAGAMLLHHCARRVEYVPSESNMARLEGLMRAAIAWMGTAGKAHPRAMEDLHA